jgi:hypothetical protein
MNSVDPAVLRAQRVFAELSTRLAAVGLPLLHVSPAKQLLNSHGRADDFESLAPLLALPKGTAQPTILTTSDGRWLVQSAMRLSSRVGWMATVIDGASSSESIPPHVRQLGLLMHSMVQDLARIDADTETIAQFSERLAQSYEEVALLFRMARLLNRDDAPDVLVTRFIEEIAQIVPFGWIAVQFGYDLAVHPALRGRLLQVGSAAGPLDGVCSSMFEMLRADPATKLLRADPSKVAQNAGGEVVGKMIRHDQKLVAALVAGDKRGADADVSSFELQFLDAAAEFLGIFHENISMFMGTLQALSFSLEAKDPYTQGHSARVAQLSKQMAIALGLGEEVAERYHIAGLVHDIGKIGVPEAVLCKPGKPTDEEFAMIKQHPTIGHRILKDIPALQDALPGVLHHHEKWNAMSSNRSYRSAVPREKVREEIRKCGGSQFDPSLVETFLALDFSEFDAMLALAAAPVALAA